MTSEVARMQSGIARPNPGLHPGYSLVYAQARFYDPLVGRFLSIDPMSFSDESTFSFSRYTYSNNNPYKYTDPDGEASAPTQVAPNAPTISARIEAAAPVAARFPVVAAAAAIAVAAEGLYTGQSPFPAVSDALSDLMTEVMSDSGADAPKDKQSTLSPGPSAGDSIPARGPERNFTPEERSKINGHRKRHWLPYLWLERPRYKERKLCT
ncbi:MAG: RHS repeat-associated core domain-containing protein [Nevskia sp.]|nr:RHS repeat-associated core domain-containing protein [Nevskia sp.]